MQFTSHEKNDQHSRNSSIHHVPSSRIAGILTSNPSNVSILTPSDNKKVFLQSWDNRDQKDIKNQSLGKSEVVIIADTVDFEPKKIKKNS